MKPRIAAGLVALACSLALAAQKPVTPKPVESDTVLRQRLDAFFDRVLGYQGLDKIEVASISPPDGSGLREVQMHFAKGTQEIVKQYTLSGDGHEIIEGGPDGTLVSTLSADPWAATRSKLQLQGVPAEGSPGAKVTIVEFSDLECPYCKEENSNINQLLQKEPNAVRVYFKFYPLVDKHPWSMAAAVGGECVTRQNPGAFFRYTQATFDHQDELTPDTAAARLRDFAQEAGGINLSTYDACVGNPATKAAVEASIANGKAVGVDSTPTLYIDGRMIPGAVDEPTLEQLVNHEAKIETATAAAGGIKSGPVSGPQCSGDCKPLPPLPKGSGGGGRP